MTKTNPRVSILMLTFNAPGFVKLSVESLRNRTMGVDYELVVVDNASDPPTRALVSDLHDRGLIDTLVLSEENTLFAGGNNLAARHADPNATHYLLLNSDIEVKQQDWLAHLLAIHDSPGLTGFGMCTDAPLRLDGYCLLVDAPLWCDLGGLDESHQWWWAVTKFQAQAMTRGCTAKGYYKHDAWLIHFGAKSGAGFKSARGMDVGRKEVIGWFGGRVPLVIDNALMRRDLRITKWKTIVGTILQRVRLAKRHRKTPST